MNILITGGTGGLGSAIIRKLAVNTHSSIYFTYANSKETADQLIRDYENVTGIHCDFKDPSSVDAFALSIPDIEPNILINNAFLAFAKEYFHKSSPIKFLESFKNNILPVIKITSAAIHCFRKNKFGKIINVLSSSIVNKPPIGWSEYVANKNYILSLSKSWATENIKFNITSNCVSPSFMDTAFTGDIDSRVLEQMTNDHPLKKLLNVEDVADTIALMANFSQHINGANIVINAGADF